MHIESSVKHDSQHGISRVTNDLFAGFVKFAGLYLHRVEREPQGFVFVFLDPEHECENLLKEFNEHAGVSDALTLLLEYEFVRKAIKRVIREEKETRERDSVCC